MTHTITRRALLSGSGIALGAAALGMPTGRAAGPDRPHGLIRLMANENPYGPSPSARAVLQKAIGDCWQYTFQQDGELKELIAEREGVMPEHVIIGAGSAEILRIAALTYGQHGGEVITARPTFTYLTDFARELGCHVKEVDLDSRMCLDLTGMANAITSATRLIYVCNPNNPTGTLVAGPRLREFVADVSDAAALLVDEAYLDLSSDWGDHTAVPRVLAGDAVIVTRTFSKLYGMAGLRIGYAIASPDIIGRLERNRMSVVNLPGLRAAAASYRDFEFRAMSRDRIQEGRRITCEFLDDLGLAYAPSRGNFVLFDTQGSVTEFSAAMRSRGILTASTTYAPYDSWCRVSMGTVEQMKVFAAVAGEYFRA